MRYLDLCISVVGLRGILKCVFLCSWIESCVDEELPPTTELEQALRNGVILCKLGHYCDPEGLPLKKIYDLDESKYRVRLCMHPFTM